MFHEKVLIHNRTMALNCIYDFIYDKLYDADLLPKDIKIAIDDLLKCNRDDMLDFIDGEFIGTIVWFVLSLISRSDAIKIDFDKLPYFEQLVYKRED